jgi:hypothetical protein
MIEQSGNRGVHAGVFQRTEWYVENESRYRHGKAHSISSDLEVER